MPTYYFELESDDSIHTDIYYSFKDAPKIGSIVDYDGQKWRRMPAYVQASTNTQINHWSAKEFVEKTGKMKGNWGEINDMSAEMSARRAKDAGGVDPILAKKEAADEKLTGLKSFRKKKEDAKANLAKKGIILE